MAAVIMGWSQVKSFRAGRCPIDCAFGIDPMTNRAVLLVNLTPKGYLGCIKRWIDCNGCHSRYALPATSN